MWEESCNSSGGVREAIEGKLYYVCDSEPRGYDTWAWSKPIRIINVGDEKVEESPMVEERPRVEKSPRVVHEDPHLMARVVMVEANVEAFKTMMNTVAKENPPTGLDDEALSPLPAPIAVTPLPIGCDDEPVGGCVDPTPLPLPVTPLPVLFPTGCDDEPIGVEVVIPFPFAPLPVTPLPAPVLVP
ncbi:hypothetical protein RHSIM_Rhsim04G0048300 [Rhododendron simsii]|uniref:Uncharacterized protein n=1 Tax=Rhododendron simsii TaxID=118357 RepID=A0A834H220_RHOSS|nr:hypothetical protein RHSIM_Rhsim04G0048300 [Rhododendron simsii]